MNYETLTTEMRLAGEQGRQVTEQVSAGPELMVHPIFEDINIYQLDARIRGLAPDSTNYSPSCRDAPLPLIGCPLAP